ncbi:cysteine proteinase [Phlegmacium glaucopus]|nr:cysteine proteinase [Phlegmacium glaucopus]
MAKTKALTPQELYRQRREREEREKSAHLPPGLINHGNTCFMNSVLQGLIATRLLSDLVHFSPIPPEIQSASSTPIVSRRSPQLTNGHNLGGIYEQPWVNTMPIGDMFLNVMYKSWDIQENRRKEVLSPKALLGALGQKYDQYLDFAQQDAHEFLRILLDAMRMEEQDIIKKRQPPPPNHHHKKRRRTTVTANNFNNTNSATPVSTSMSTGSSAPVHHDGSDPDTLLSFADMLFGGKLTSILVCQKCKHISQTYEDFNDISLSIKPEDYFFGRGSNGHGKKREKLKKLAKRLTTFPGSGSHAATQNTSLNTNSMTTTTKPGFQDTLPAMEIQRSSSVPPSPSRPRAGDGNTHSDSENDGHSSLVEPPRRKSFDLAKTGVVGTVRRVDVDVETPTSSSVEADNENNGIEGMRKADAELEVPPPVVLSEEVDPSGLEHPEQGVPEDKVKEDEIVMESDSSHVLVHVVSPEERRVELVEPTVKAKGKDGKDKKEDVGWAKLGRRISIMTGGLGRSKDKEKTKGKERERKSWSMDRGVGTVVKEMLDSGGGSMQKNTSNGGVIQETADLDKPIERTIRRSRTTTAGDMSSKDISSASLVSNPAPVVPAPIAITASSSSSSGSASHNLLKPLPRASSSLSTSTLNTGTAASTSQLRSSQNQNQHLVAPSNTHKPPNASSTSLPLFSNVQRSRSPKPPKPTPAEGEYLRKILADVVSSSPGLNSPFSLFKPPALLLSGTHPFSTTSSHGSGGMWLGLNQFSGIEECLRLFTAVEVLDGENMVGCRRCWKIANGVLDVKSSTRQEEEDSDQEQEQEQEERLVDGDIRRHEIQPGANGVIKHDELVEANEGGFQNQRPVLQALSIADINAPVYIPTSMSTPTVSFYTLPNSSDSRSISSLPTEATSVSDGFSSKEFSEDNDNRDFLRGPGPGGMPIPTISTTSPLDTPTDARNSFARAQHLAISAKESIVEPSVMNDKNRTINGILSGQSSSINSSSSSTLSSTYITPSSSVPSPLSMQSLSAHNASGSKDSLLIPKRPKYHQRRKTSSTSPSASATDNDESSDDEESDTSVGTSVSGRSYASASVTDSTTPNMHSSTHPSSTPQPKSQGQQRQQQQQTYAAEQQTSIRTSTAQQPKPKEKKPKPVMMRPAYKRYLIAVPPPVLVIHLKRFQQTSKMPLISFSHGLKKLDDYVSFPEYLDLMPFLAPKKEDYGLGKSKRKKGVVKNKEEKCMYRLYAVVVHIGNMLGGHYIAYTALPSGSSSTTSIGAATPEEGAEPTNTMNPQPESTAQSTTKSARDERQWAFISDTVVRLTTLEEVLHAKAYICMYERC